MLTPVANLRQGYRCEVSTWPWCCRHPCLEGSNQWFGNDRSVTSNDWSKKPANHAGWSMVTLKKRNQIFKQNTIWRCEGTGQDRLPTGAIAIMDAIVIQDNKIAFKPIQETNRKTVFTVQGWQVPKSGHQGNECMWELKPIKQSKHSMYLDIYQSTKDEMYWSTWKSSQKYLWCIVTNWLRGVNWSQVNIRTLRYTGDCTNNDSQLASGWLMWSYKRQVQDDWMPKMSWNVLFFFCSMLLG